MTKCPYCGSTAQVKYYSVNQLPISKNNFYQIRECKCGCGTYFIETIKVENNKIVSVKYTMHES